jgi:hypothetical protein
VKIRLAALALLAAGCGAGDDCSDPAAAGAEIGLGDLDTGFSSMTDGTAVPIVLGPQGLNMIVVSVRATGLAPTGDGAYPVAVEVDHDGELVAGTLGPLVPETGPDGADDFLGLRVIFTVAEVRPLDGVMAEVTATITDGCDRDLVAVRVVRLTL